MGGWERPELPAKTGPPGGKSTMMLERRYTVLGDIYRVWDSRLWVMGHGAGVMGVMPGGGPPPAASRTAIQHGEVDGIVWMDRINSWHLRQSG